MVRLEKHLVDAYASGSRWAQYLQVPGVEKFQISFLIFEFSDLVLKVCGHCLFWSSLVHHVLDPFFFGLFRFFRTQLTPLDAKQVTKMFIAVSNPTNGAHSLVSSKIVRVLPYKNFEIFKIFDLSENSSKQVS